MGSRFSFSVVKIDTPCTRGEAGYFELTNSDSGADCIELPKVDFTFTPVGGVESSVHNGDPNNIIKIKFDSTISYVDTTASNLSKQNIFRNA